MNINKKFKILTGLSILGISSLSITIPLTISSCADSTAGKYFKAPFTDKLYKRLYTQLNAIAKLDGTIPISDAKVLLNTSDSKKALADSLLNIDVEGVSNVDVMKNKITLSFAKTYFADTQAPLTYNNTTLNIKDAKIIITPNDSNVFFADDPAPFSEVDAKKLYDAINAIVSLDNTVRFTEARNKLQDSKNYSDIKQKLNIKPNIESISVVDRKTISITLSARAYGNNTVKYNNIDFKNENNIISLTSQTDLFTDNLVEMSQQTAIKILVEINKIAELNNTIRLSDAQTRLNNNQALMSSIKNILLPIKVNINSINVLDAQTIEIELDQQYFSGVLNLSNGLILTNANKKITMTNSNNFFLANLVNFTDIIAQNLLKTINDIASIDKKLTVNEANLKLNGQNVFDKIKQALGIVSGVRNIQATSLNSISIELDQIPFNNKKITVYGMDFSINDHKIVITGQSNMFILKFDADIAVNLTNALNNVVKLDKTVRFTTAKNTLENPDKYPEIAKSISNQISVTDIKLIDIGTIKITIDKPIFTPIIQIFNDNINFSVVDNFIQLSKTDDFFLRDLPIFTKELAIIIFDMLSKQAKLDGSLTSQQVNFAFENVVFRVHFSNALLGSPPSTYVYVNVYNFNTKRIIIVPENTNIELFQPTTQPIQVNDHITLTVDSDCKLIHFDSTIDLFKI